jgi:hypothetical protein
MVNTEIKDGRGILACAVQCWVVYVKMTISFFFLIRERERAEKGAESVHMRK